MAADATHLPPKSLPGTAAAAPAERVGLSNSAEPPFPEQRVSRYGRRIHCPQHPGHDSLPECEFTPTEYLSNLDAEKKNAEGY